MSPPTRPRRLAEELDAHVAFLRRLAAGLVGVGADADDLVQDTLVTALERPPRAPVHERLRVRAWLSRVLRNKASNRRRDEGRRAAHGPRIARERAEGQPSAPPDVAARTEIARTLLACIDELPLAQREALVLRYFEGLPPREIAARLDVPVGTVKTRLKRALDGLRARMDARDGERRWELALGAAFALRRAPPATGGTTTWSAARAAALAGGVIVSTTKKAAVVLLVAALGGLAWWGFVTRGTESGPQDSAAAVSGEPRPQTERVRVHREPDRPRVATGTAAADAGATPSSGSPAPGGPAVVLGRVVDEETERPIAGAVVRWGVLPVAAMGRLRASIRDRELRTDADGRFRIEVQPDELGPEISLDVQAPGYGSLVGPISRGVRDASRVRPRAGRTERLDLRLTPTLHVAGVVVDVRGAPVPGVEVLATDQDDQGYGYVMRTITDDAGRFAVFDFERGRGPDIPMPRAHLAFEHADYLDAEVADCRALGERERASLRVVIQRGHDVVGTVLSADGAPVDGLLVEAFDADGARLRGATTMPGGRFALTGLAEGVVRLRVVDAARMRIAAKSIDLYTHEPGVELVLEAADVGEVPRHRLLSLELADVTPRMRAALELPDYARVLVVGVGTEDAALEIGELRPGDAFLTVGTDEVESVEDLVTRVLQAADAPSRRDGAFRVRVVYAFSRDDFAGTNTQSMRVIATQEEALRHWLAEHR